MKLYGRVEYQGSTQDTEEELVEFFGGFEQQAALNGSGSDLEGSVWMRKISKRSCHAGTRSKNPARGGRKQGNRGHCTITQRQFRGIETDACFCDLQIDKE